GHIAHFHGLAGLEAVHHLLEFAEVEVAVEHRDHRALDELLDDLVFPAVFDGLELDLAAERRDDVREVANARYHAVLARDNRPAQSVREHRFVVRDAGADANAGALVHIRAAARET